MTASLSGRVREAVRGLLKVTESLFHCLVSRPGSIYGSIRIWISSINGTDLSRFLEGFPVGPPSLFPMFLLGLNLPPLCPPSPSFVLRLFSPLSPCLRSPPLGVILLTAPRAPLTGGESPVPTCSGLPANTYIVLAATKSLMALLQRSSPRQCMGGCHWPGIGSDL